MIELTCPRCGAPQRLAPSAAGTRQVCTACQQTFKAPAFLSPKAAGPSARAPKPTTPSATTAAKTPPAATPATTSPPAVAAPLPPAKAESAADDAPLPFDSLEEHEAPRPTSPATPKPAPHKPAAPASRIERAAGAPRVDKDQFYGDEVEEALESKDAPAPAPKQQTASHAPVYIDHRHRVFNDEGLILVVCGVCGTRMHFDPKKEGTKQQCPDCLTQYVLPKLPPGPVKKKSEPRRDQEDEFKLEETFERPGYQPLTRDSVAAELLHGPVLGAPATLPPPAGPTSAPAGGGAPSAPQPPPFPGGPATAARPPSPAGPAPSAATLPPSGPARMPAGPASASPAAPSPAGGANPLTMIDPASRLQRPPNWAILNDTFGFAFRPYHLLALLGIAILIMGPIVLGLLLASVAPNLALAVIFVVATVPPLVAAPLMFLFSFMVHIIHDSSYGERDAKNWSIIQVGENFIAAIYVFCAIFFAGLPGLLLGFLLIPLFGPNVQTLMIVLSAVMFLPYTLLALLEEESYWQCYSPEVLASFRRSADQVFLFCCSAFVFSSVCAAAIFGIASVGSEEPGVIEATLIFSAIVLVFLYWAITYARMVGRLAWVMNYEAQFGPLDDD